MASFPGDSVKKVQASVVRERRYCKATRVCARTGWESTCGAPLWRSDEFCQVCWLLGLERSEPDTRSARMYARRDWNESAQARGAANHWEYQHADVHRMDIMTLEQRESLERNARPRVKIEDVEPYWQCSVRDVLDEMGITAEVMELSDDVLGVRDIGQQLPRELQLYFFDYRYGYGNDHGPTPLQPYPTGPQRTSHEWREAIARLHQYSARWIDAVGNALALHSKPRFTITGPRPKTMAWRVVEMTSQVASMATVAYGAVAYFASAGAPMVYGAVSSVTGLSHDTVTVQQTTAIVDDSDEYGDDDE